MLACDLYLANWLRWHQHAGDAIDRLNNVPKAVAKRVTLLLDIVVELPKVDIWLKELGLLLLDHC